MTVFEIDISQEHPQWHDTIKNIDGYTVDVLEKILKQALPQKTHIEISIVLANDSFIQELNSKYRNKDKPTNVLSFPQTELEDLKLNIPFISLGDIIISFETIEREAKEQNKEFKNHYTHMLTHGCLHLLHYDHMTEEEAEVMEKLEIEILEDLGIKNPYELQQLYGTI